MQRGQDFSLRVLLRANFEFLFFKFSALPLSLLTLPLCFPLFPFFTPFLSVVLFAPLLAAAGRGFMGGWDTGRMRVAGKGPLKLASSASPGFFQWI